jgi:hypothetical protein
MELKIKQQIIMKNQSKMNFLLKILLKIFFIDLSSSKFSKERLAQFRNLSERPDIYELLSNAIGMMMFNISRIF